MVESGGKFHLALIGLAETFDDVGLLLAIVNFCIPEVIVLSLLAAEVFRATGGGGGWGGTTDPEVFVVGDDGRGTGTGGAGRLGSGGAVRVEARGAAAAIGGGGGRIIGADDRRSGDSIRLLVEFGVARRGV